MENRDYKAGKSKFLWGNRPFWITILFVLSVILSVMKPVELADGGAITYFSMFFVWLITFFYGPKIGIPVSVIYGIPKFLVTYFTNEGLQPDLQLIADNLFKGAGNVLSSDQLFRGIMTFILEYPLACGALAIGGLIFADSARFMDSGERELETYRSYSGVPKGHIPTEHIKLKLGYLTGVIGMGVFYIIADVLFYSGEETFGFKVLYNMSFLLLEAAVTLLILLIPSVTDAIFFLKQMATKKYEDPTLKYF